MIDLNRTVEIDGEKYSIKGENFRAEICEVEKEYFNRPTVISAILQRMFDIQIQAVTDPEILLSLMKYYAARMPLILTHSNAQDAELKKAVEKIKTMIRDGDEYDEVRRHLDYLCKNQQGIYSSTLNRIYNVVQDNARYFTNLEHYIEEVEKHLIFK